MPATDYQKVKEIGSGSFGRAYLVEHKQAKGGEKKLLVLKEIDLSGRDQKERAAAEVEVKVLSSLKHPYIVRYWESFMKNHQLCIVMDYCEGGDLSSRIKKARAGGQSFSQNQVLWWFTQGVQALKYIHDRHILHRDLKSGNFFLSKSGNIKMGDFGIAKVLDCTAACAQTQVGTPYYLCPEICKGKPYSWGSDIWAMGVILYEMSALRVPFDGHDLKSLILRITKAPTPELPAQYTSDLQDILNMLLNRNPAVRPHADEILEIPLVEDMVTKIERRGSEADSEVPPRRGSAASSEAGQRPASVTSKAPSSAQYSDSAGGYAKRDKVEYYSETHSEWLPANITDVDSKGRILMDVKPNTWITIEVQAEKVRPRTPPPCQEQKAVRRPSTADSAARNGPSKPVSARDGRPQDKAQPPLSRRRSAPGSRPSAPGSDAAPRGKPAAGGMRRHSGCPEVPASARRAVAHLGA